MAGRRTELQAYNGPVYVVQEDDVETLAGRTPKTLIDFDADLTGNVSATTEAAITSLIGAGYVIRLGTERSPIY